MEARAPWTEHEDEAEPMLAEQFDIAMEQTQIRTPELIRACKSVLVDNKKASEVARSLGIEAAHVGRAVNTVREKWQKICEAEGWAYFPIALPDPAMNVVLEMQRANLVQYRARVSKTGSRKKKKKK